MTHSAPHPQPRRGARAALAALALALVATSCTGTRKITDPIIVVSTDGGTELGVSTEYGVVFTGATAERGEVEITSWFGDGPSIERSVIEPVGAELFTAEVDIDLPSVQIDFSEPRDGERLEIRGRRRQSSGAYAQWTTTARVRTDPRVLGLLLEIPSGFPDDPDQVGAGVFRVKGPHERELVGLVVGKVRLQQGSRTRRYLAVAGPNELWRLAAHRRDLLRPDPMVYREDIL